MALEVQVLSWDRCKNVADLYLLRENYEKPSLFFRTGEHAAYILDPAKSIWDLFFTDIQKQDEGRYFCIASNNFAVPMSRTSNSADVQIEGMFFILFLSMCFK